MRGRLQTLVFGAVVAAALASAAPALGQAHPPAVAGPPAPHTDDAHGHAAGHGSHKHHVSVLLGAAHNGHIDETGFTIGVGCRYALSDRFAIGPMADFAFYDSENTSLLVAALFWRPVGSLLLVAGPGVEWVDEKGHGHDAHAGRSAEGGGEESSGGRFAFRVGAAYELHAGKLTISPAVGADFIDGHTTTVYAVSFGLGFFLNDAALKAAGIDKALVAALPKSAQEQLSLEKGHFFEQGAMPILPKISPFLASPAAFKKGLEYTETYYHRNGITRSSSSPTGPSTASS